MAFHHHRTNVEQRELKRQEWVAASKYYQSWEVCKETDKKLNSQAVYDASIKASTLKFQANKKTTLESRRIKLRNLLQSEEAVYAKELDDLRKSTWKPLTSPLPQNSSLLDTFNREKPSPRPNIRPRQIIQETRIPIQTQPLQPQAPEIVTIKKSNLEKESKLRDLLESEDVLYAKELNEMAIKNTQFSSKSPKPEEIKENVLPDENANPHKPKEHGDGPSAPAAASVPFQPHQENKQEVPVPISQKPPLEVRRYRLHTLFHSEEADYANTLNQRKELQQNRPTTAPAPSTSPTSRRRGPVQRSNSKRSILNID